MTVLILAIIFTTQNLGLSSRITNQQWRLFINPLSLFYCNFTANDAGITYPNSSSDKGARSNSFNWARFDFIFITALDEVFLAYDSIIIREKKKTEDPYTLRPVPRVLDCLYQKQKKNIWFIRTPWRVESQPELHLRVVILRLLLRILVR